MYQEFPKLSVAVHLFYKLPPKSYTEITAIKSMKNIKRTITSIITGIESRIVDTNFGIPGTFLINFIGLNILRILFNPKTGLEYAYFSALSNI